MINPCFDEATKTDCPGRHAGCAVDCPAWAEYVRARNAEYEKKRIENDTKTFLMDGQARRSKKFHKRNINARQKRVKYYHE